MKSSKMWMVSPMPHHPFTTRQRPLKVRPSHARLNKSQSLNFASTDMFIPAIQGTVGILQSALKNGYVCSNYQHRQRSHGNTHQTQRETHRHYVLMRGRHVAPQRSDDIYRERLEYSVPQGGRRAGKQLASHDNLSRIEVACRAKSVPPPSCRHCVAPVSGPQTTAYLRILC